MTVISDSAMRRIRLLGVGLMIVTIPATADWQINLDKGVTPISKDIYDLHMTILGILAVIGLLLYGVLFYILVKHRHSKGAVAAKFDSNRKLEWLWTLLPFLILIVLAVPATNVLFAMDDFAKTDVTVKITASQWHWEYQYLDQGIGFYSTLATPQGQLDGEVPRDPQYLREVDRPLVLPVNKKVRFLVTSSDVIHSWWVPQLGIKRDAIPGFINESWARIERKGVFRGQCAELCGVGHGYMPIVVKAVGEEDFVRWVDDEKRRMQLAQQPAQADESNWTLPVALERGENVYNRYCSACHQVDGTGIPPLYPSLVESSVTVGEPLDRHIDIVLHGIRGSAMQAFADQLNDVQIAAIITYERNAWGLHTGDLVTPSRIQARRTAKQGRRDD